ncbi:multiheme c-type cytochrome [Candidatus Parabeggiatoa sp. HSG14]|uniref:multiheme c-type cytochrome n=1 Tax=Candidatus Parabeggiatoa sp. HSG14 TaxID=3055593 RepID=UPI0025A8D798|nr:multiheme c-type cytochrome [Thiotrichales bacterium HSG14]
MFIKRGLSLALVSIFLYMLSNSALAASKEAEAAKKKELNNECVGCHINVNPGIVRQFLDSPMSNPPEKVDAVVCTDCHGEDHETADDYKNAEMPTPETCGECHEDQVDQLREGKHNLAWFAMKSQIAWHGQPGSISQEGYRGCSGCHKIGQKGLKGIMQGVTGEIEHDDGEEQENYRYGNVQCDACHTRHTFNKSEAQDPRACSNCHMGFDHPQWEMYMSNKHGVIWDIEGNKNVRGRAPTCQYCHMSEGNHAVKTSWGFLGLRIPTKHNVLALAEQNPSLKEPLEKLAKLLPEGNYIDVDDDPEWVLDRALIFQAAGILDANLQPTERFIEIVVQGKAAHAPDDFNENRVIMKETCNECHSKHFVDVHFKASDEIIKAADHEFAKAIKTVQGLYKDGILRTPPEWKYAPDLLQYYDAKTKVEQELYLILLEYRQRAFQGAFHGSNDYMHWYGWAPLKTAVATILEESRKMRAEHEAKHAK